MRAGHISLEAGVVPQRGSRQKSTKSDKRTTVLQEAAREFAAVFTVSKEQKAHVAAVRAVPLPHEAGAFAFAALTGGTRKAECA